MATIRSRSGQTVTVPDSTLKTYLEQGWTDVNVPAELTATPNRKARKPRPSRARRAAAKPAPQTEPDTP
ncbi:hypothetical protein C5E11_03890 [Clavibacter michiganensis]|nr:hypothetical protein [Clavibacter michiganensis]PPF64543.1 hypothetical protein C5E11_03890 [Clavibacter michiganensis]